MLATKNGEVPKIHNPTYSWNLGEKDEEEACSFALSFLTSGVKVPVLKAVVELGVLDLISQCGPGGHMSAAEIASRLPTSNPEAAAMLGRLLDYLASYTVLTVATTTSGGDAVERRYGLGPMCKFLITNEDGVSYVPFTNDEILKTMVNSSLCLKDAILKGTKPFVKAFGMPIFEYDAKHPEHQNVFHKAMSNHSTIIIRKVLATYKGFEGISTLVDVGGGNGATLNMIVSQYPTIKGINFDQPHIITNAPSYPGVKHIGGNMFESIPKGDAIFLKWVCHCFKDEVCVKILKNCYDALPKHHGKVIICEHLLPEPSETNSTGDINSNSVIQFDMIMMLVPDGKERTRKNFEALAFAAGFRDFQVVSSAYNFKIIELLKI